MTIVTAGQFILDEVSHQITGGKNLELWYDFKDSLNSILTEGRKNQKSPERLTSLFGSGERGKISPDRYFRCTRTNNNCK